VLVLNATFEPINVCTVRRAIGLLLKAKAEVLEEAQWSLHAERIALARPFVIRLTNYVRLPRDAHRRKITRRAVFARDDWTCQYCGVRANLTVDHVIPRSKGGLSSWENIVASCAPCNRRSPACTRYGLLVSPVPRFSFASRRPRSRPRGALICPRRHSAPLSTEGAPWGALPVDLVVQAATRVSATSWSQVFRRD
jgi:5-methylcytosine-specific restriction endonuclease McrA